MLCNPDTTILVTGGGSGLGRGTVEHLRGLGCKVSVLDLPNDAVADELAALGVQFIPCDITAVQALDTAIEKVVKVNGIPGVVVNCAGIAPAARAVGRNGAHDAALFQRVVAVNLTGTFLVGSRLAAHMQTREPGPDQERGVIINTASVAAYEGQVGQCAYAASKAWIVGLTLPMARDLASLGIRVCAIAPGIFETPMVTGMPQEVQDSLAAQIPFPRRLGRPSDYAALVQHIVENRMLNGEVIRLDGAIRMGPR